MTSRKIPESAVENLVSDLEGKANVENTVTTNTNQTITGQKSFTNSLRRKSTNIDITTQSENYTANNGFQFVDKNENVMGYLENAQTASGEIKTGIHARNKDGYQQNISVLVPPSGTTGAYANAPTPPANSAGNEIVTAKWVRNAFLRPGEIIIWSTPTPPAGYLICDGSAISRTTYADLFHVIGTTWGAGDGNTTFNLPTANDFPTGYPGTYSDIAAGPSGSSYIAPKNGWYSTHCTALDGDQVYIEFVNETAAEFGIVQEAAFNGVMRIFIPAKKGDRVFFYYRNLHSIDNFRFFEDKGQQMIIKY